MSSSRNSSTSAAIVCRIERRSIGPGADSSMSRSRALPRVRDPLGRLDLAVLDRDDRLDREQRADRRLGAADPPAPLEVLERLEGDVHPEVGRPVVEDAGDLGGRDAPLRHLDGPARRGCPRPSTPTCESTMWISRSGSRPFATSALLIVPGQRRPTTWTETIASAPVVEAPSRRRPGTRPGWQAAVFGNGASGAVIRAQNSRRRQVHAGAERLVAERHRQRDDRDAERRWPGPDPGPTRNRSRTRHGPQLPSSRPPGTPCPR